jgi:uncharacterized membrane protein SpoIIM required for sporulation
LRETTFIEQKKDNWAKFEKMHRLQESDPDEMTRLFVEITDDLSYSRTFYQKRSVRVYLNFLAQMVFLKINKNKKFKLKKFVNFWTYSLPMEFARSWKAMLLSLVIFSASMMIGILSTYKDVGFAREIMGDAYVDMTDRNIANGDPMAVYHEHGTSLSSTYKITLNNTLVAARTYASGLFTGLPTASILISNGISIGAFHQYLNHKGVLGEALFVVWIHGVLEISAIIIAGGAGFVFGIGLLFPGSYTRMQAFRISAKRSFKIALSTIFILIFSGFIEGSVTRYTQMPFIFKAIIIGGSIVFIIGYFVLYPMYLYRKYIKRQGLKFEDRIPHIEEQKIEVYKVREVGDLYSDTLGLMRHCFGNFFKGLFLTGIPIIMGLAIYYFAFISHEKDELFWYYNLRVILMHESKLWTSLVTTIVMFSSVTLSGYYAIQQYRKDAEFSTNEFYKFVFFNFLKLWPLHVLTIGVFFWQSPFVYPILILVSPILYHITYSGFFDDREYKSQLKSTWKILRKSWFGSIGFWLLLFVIPLLMVGLTSWLFGSNEIAVFSVVIDYLQDNISPLVDNPAPYFNSINFFLYALFASTVYFLLLLGMIVQFHSVKERIEAHNLYIRLQEFGTRNKLFEQAGEGEY